MNPTQRRSDGVCCAILVLSIFSVVWAGTACFSEAAPYPDRQIKFIVPFKPGGGVDTQTRILVPFIEKYLPKKVTIVVQNQPTAGGKVAALQLFDAAPDGYTLGMIMPNSLGLLHVMGDLEKRDPADLTYLGRVGYAPYMLIIGTRGRFKNVREMKGEQVKFGGPTGAVFQTALIAKYLEAKMTYVSYDGLPETALAVMRGDIDGMCMNWDSIIKQVDASEGKLVPVVIAAENRLPKLPNVPTTREMGLVLSPGVVDVMGSGNAVLAPPRLPPEVRSALEKAVSMAINDPEAESQMQKANYTVKPILSPKETRDLAMRVVETYVKNKDLLQTVR